MVCAGFTRDFCFLSRRHRSNHLGASNFGDLTEQDTATAGGGMDQAACSGCKREGRGREIVRGQALEHNCGGFLKTDLFGKRDDAFRRSERMRRVGARSKYKSNAVANLDVCDIRADAL